jgi:hypothetical protein
MKKLKLITAVIAVLTLSNLISAANPKNGKSDNLADLVIEKLNKDVQLTDSQKIILIKRFNVFVNKMDEANNKSTEKDKFNSKKQYSDDYEIVLDSVLSSNQKQQLSIKIAERKKNK